MVSKQFTYLIFEQGYMLCQASKCWMLDIMMGNLTAFFGILQMKQ